jgi:hypothetical protein
VTGVCALAVAGSLLGTAADAAPAKPSTGVPEGARLQVASTGGTANTGGSLARAATGTATGHPVLRTRPVPTVAAAAMSSARGAEAEAPRLVASMPAQRQKPFETVAVTWDDNSAPGDMDIDVRVRRADGWSGWQHLEYALDEGPAATEETGVRDGTGLWWSGPADGVAVRVTSASGQSPTGLSVVTIDDPSVAAEGEVASIAAASTTSAAAASSASASPGAPITRSPRFPKRPRVVTRPQWHANESLRDDCDSPRYGKTTKMVFVHHTVGDNDYSRSEAPAIVRSILAYHTQGQGWCDLGYNFLVDRFGTIYQGRAGGVQLPVRGAHAGDYNVNTSGISLMGNFERQGPSRRMKNAMVRLVGWKLGTSYREPRTRTTVAGDSFRRISGHRDAMSTACPGAKAYAWLPTLRKRVAGYLERYSSPVRRKAAAMGVDKTGPVFAGELQVGNGRRTDFTRGSLVGNRATGVHWLSGTARKRYDSVGGARGVLGLPVSHFFRSPAGVRSMKFEHGRILRRPDGAAKALWGRILLRYGKVGYTDGRLGLPRTSVQRVSYGSRAVFQKGVIRYDHSSGRVTVRR